MTSTEAAVVADLRVPENAADKVRIGKILSDNSPGDKVSMEGYWQYQRDHVNLVSPLNRREFCVVAVGTDLAGGTAATVLGELDRDIKAFTHHDAPCRVHSTAAQDDISSAYGKEADSNGTCHYVKDTVRGGDYRCRENDYWRLAVESVRAIDHLSAIGTPFVHEYGDTLATRSFGGVQVSRAHCTRGQTDQQLRLSTTSALQRQIGPGNIEIFTHDELVDIIVAGSHCQGAIVCNLITGELTARTARTVILVTGGYGNVYHMSTLAKNSSASVITRAYDQGAYLTFPSFIQFYPTGLPVNAHWQSKTILMSESLCNNARIQTPKKKGDEHPANDIPEDEYDYFLERRYPAFDSLVPRNVASRASSQQINAGRGISPLKNSVYLDLRDATECLGRPVIKGRYSNLIQMYEEAIGEDPHKIPMRIAPTYHFTMGGLRSDFSQMTSTSDLFTGDEVSWIYHGANRLGTNSLLPDSVDGWFTLPFTTPSYLGPPLGTDRLAEDAPEAKGALDHAQARLDKLMGIRGKHGAEYFHHQLGEVLYHDYGAACSKEGLARGIEEIRELRKAFWFDLLTPGEPSEMNQQLEYADRTADYIDLGEFMCVDALDRDELCGACCRDDHISEDGEVKCDGTNWCFVSAWERDNNGPTWDQSGHEFIRHAEPLTLETAPLATRNYK